ncbi:PREDICTED: mitochondrial sodium/hydrogen exchanger 9B2-like [Nicrophorus vespilloides]|uniref:Mitochondrial sodium/hydrogen exchanger 9B2-like n=1 Tax=Nicrophorus vespilloides TaxID=110193 RepID=A0ABM1MP13_NICVS|nr:PREDICTED: mitochondrial sodium/hydrogen exchanger 9B2-like [Nicrophorus vespilloides]XP_017776314.1 PREDICTED: mitochondrial sodium/hydrogen exchanger 9B2-like [Nicrophorus vespilloides]
MVQDAIENGMPGERPIYGTFNKSETIMKTKSFIRKIWIGYSYIPSLILLALVLWAIGYSLFGDKYAGIESQLFSLAVLFILAKIVGCLVAYLKIPPMVGMLLVGVLLRNVGFLHITGNYRNFTSVLRQLALVNIMLPAGLGMDPKALKKLIGMILNLAIVPVAVEVVAIAVASHFLLNLPWLWGVLLGLLLAAVSPAVIIPCLFQLQDMGYGVNKGVHTLVIAASTFNDIICIALFGIVLGIIFSTGTLVMQILQGPIVLAIGFGFGIVWGFVCRLVPSKHEDHVVTLRTLLLGLGCVLSAVGSDAIGYGGAGALGCIVAAFVASLGWRKEGWDNNNPVRLNFILLWKFFEPISFGLIGMEVNFEILEGYTVLYGTIAMTAALLLRMVTSFAVTQCSNLNLKENIFVAISWIPKATVQAALGPAALDIAWSLGDKQLIEYSNVVIIVAVISIIITSPIGAVLIMQLGPRFLHRTTENTATEVLPEVQVSQIEMETQKSN